MEVLSIIFIIMAILNIIFALIKWVSTGENQFSTIAGWTCAIMYCILELLNNK